MFNSGLDHEAALHGAHLGTDREHGQAARQQHHPKPGGDHLALGGRHRLVLPAPRRAAVTAG